MEERINHDKSKDGFSIEIGLLSPIEKLDKIIQLEGKIDIDIVNNEDIVILTDIESLLKNQRAKLDSPQLDKIGAVSIEQGDLSMEKIMNKILPFPLKGVLFQGYM